MPIKLVGVVQASSEFVTAYSDPMVSAQVSLISQVAPKDGEEDFVGSEGSATTNYDSDSNFEGVHLPGPTIRELVEDLDKFWGNSKDWEADVVVEFLHTLGSNLPHSEHGDRMIWKLSKKGDFNVHSFYDKL